MNPTEYMQALGARAKLAARAMAVMGESRKNMGLLAAADALANSNSIEAILTANSQDIANAEKNGIRPVMIDRLRLDEKRIAQIAAGLREVAALPDPVGGIVGGGQRPNGLTVTRVRVPLGVVGIIYESRPNVTADAAALCIKAGNACILRGGKEAIATNKALARVLGQAMAGAGLPEDCLLLVEDISRECAQAMMKLNGYIDVLIPRGGAGLIRSVVENATIPVIETGIGNCHLYLDSPCSTQMALDILVNAKCSRPSVCNAVETLLIHREIAESMLPLCREALEPWKVELRGCPETVRILGSGVKAAGEDDYATEFCDYILAVRVVSGIEQAMEHISRYSTGHSEAIVTDDYSHGRLFAARVDAAAVYINSSTRFTDGGELGLGAEIGISTQKLHARGPMGLEALTTTKHIIQGDGQIRV